MSRVIWAASAVLVLTGALCRADEVYLVNGDHLTGKVKNLADGMLTFESDMAGEVKIEMSKVVTLKTVEPVEVHLTDGTVMKKPLEKSEQGKFAIAGDAMLKAQEFDVNAITLINPPPPEKPKWKGDISAGLMSTRGNTVIDNQTLAVNLTKRGENDRTLLSADYMKSKQEDPDTGEKKTIQDEWRMRGRYDYFFTKKCFGYLDGRYERDRIALLDRRVIVGVGAGYQWVESEPFNFSTEAGIASVYEKYDDASDSESQLAAQLGYHLDKQLAKWLKFINDLTYYPGLEKFSDYFLTTTAELRAHMTEHLFTNFKVVFDYDATPAEDRGSTDVKYILGAGWSF